MLGNFLRSGARLSRPVGFRKAFSAGVTRLNGQPQVSDFFLKMLDNHDESESWFLLGNFCF